MTNDSLRISLRLLLLMLAAAFLTTNTYAQTGFIKDDAYTQTNTPNQNFDPNANLRVGSGINSYLKFDLSTLPAGTTGNNVAKVTLRLWVNTVTTAGSFDIRRVTSTWDEATITANSSPTLGSTDVSGASVSTLDDGSFVSVEVTALFKDWLNGLLTNNGMALVANAANTNVRFDSKENGQTSHEPRLEIILKGPQGLNWKGAWSAVTTYGIDDAVSYNGSSWIAKLANTNVTPVEGAVWTIVAEKGDTGATGSTGATGPQGPVGPTGATGSDGPMGPAGPTGATGPQGVKGLNWTGVWSSATNYLVDDAVSYGGSSWIAKRANANVAPIEGDDWTIIAQRGEIGATGPTGPQGIQGPQGATGPQGSTGPQGLQGSPGANGAQGPAGEAGATGPSGPQGSVGPTGPSGATGPEGPAGPTGATGATGPSGPAGAVAQIKYAEGVSTFFSGFFPETVNITTGAASGLLEVAFSFEGTQITGETPSNFRLTLYIDLVEMSNKSYRFQATRAVGGSQTTTFSGTWIVPIAGGAHTVNIVAEQLVGGFRFDKRLLVVKEILQ